MTSSRFALLLALLVSASLAQTPLDVEGLPADAPLSLEARLDVQTLVVAVTMKPEWHLYARDVGGGQPVSLAVLPGSAWEAAGDPVVPGREDGTLSGSFELKLPLRAKQAGQGFRARFEFMACDPLACLPPMAVTLSEAKGESKPLRLLVVADVEDARSERLRALFEAEGMSVSFATYETVTSELCDGFDVVLADSKRFRENKKGSVGRARRFPRTKTPLIAVGFLGTELIEGQGLAMTSGYI